MTQEQNDAIDELRGFGFTNLLVLAGPQNGSIMVRAQEPTGSVWIRVPTDGEYVSEGIIKSQ